MTPTVHLNGTGGDDLLEQKTSAAQKVQDAIAALRDAWPHERDYYVAGPDAILAARVKYAGMLERLEAVRDELYREAEAISAQIVARQCRGR